MSVEYACILFVFLGHFEGCGRVGIHAMVAGLLNVRLVLWCLIHEQP